MTYSKEGFIKGGERKKRKGGGFYQKHGGEIKLVMGGYTIYRKYDYTYLLLLKGNMLYF